MQKFHKWYWHLSVDTSTSKNEKYIILRQITKFIHNETHSIIAKRLRIVLLQNIHFISVYHQKNLFEKNSKYTNHNSKYQKSHH